MARRPCSGGSRRVQLPRVLYRDVGGTEPPTATPAAMGRPARVRADAGGAMAGEVTLRGHGSSSISGGEVRGARPVR